MILCVQVWNETLKKGNTLSIDLNFAIIKFFSSIFEKLFEVFFFLLEKHFVVLKYPTTPHSLDVYLQTLLQPLPDNIIVNTQQAEFTGL